MNANETYHADLMRTKALRYIRGIRNVEKATMKIRAFDSIGPGKFSNRADRRVYLMSLDGTGDTIGDCSEIGWCVTVVEGHILGLAQAGALVEEDEQGFVGVSYFDTEKDFQRAVRAVEANAAQESEG